MQDINIRAGTIEDLPQIRKLCRNVWEGHDYIPYVWEEWLQTPGYQVWVFESKGQLAGFYCLIPFIGEQHRQHRASWIKGVRVALEFRRKGIARLILEHAIKISTEQHFEVVRYATDHDNTPMHILADRLGFRYVGLFSYLAAPPLTESSEAFANCRPMRLDELQTAWDFIQRCPTWEKGEGLYAVVWNWRDLELPLLKTQIERNLVFGCFEKNELTALAIAHYNSGDEEVSVGWLDGSLPAVENLSRYLQQKATELTNLTDPEKKVLMMLALKDEKRDELLQKKYNFDFDAGERVYELKLFNRQTVTLRVENQV